MSMVSCVAVDLGASNGRVVVVDWDGDRLSLREARRFETPQRRDRETGYQCWDLDGIESEVVSGLRAAAAMAPAVSVGVDGWAVDYVLVDAARRRRPGRLVSRRSHPGMMESPGPHPAARSTVAPASIPAVQQALTAGGDRRTIPPAARRATSAACPDHSTSAGARWRR